MAKPQFVSIRFEGDSASTLFTHVVYKKLPVKDDALRFLHIERKGNTNFLFDATRFVDELPDSLAITWDRAGDSATFTIAERKYAISIYTVIDVERDSPFYFLDELPDGTWRLCHSLHFIPWHHEHLDTITIEKVSVEVQ
jgi:hypothetical protein